MYNFLNLRWFFFAGNKSIKHMKYCIFSYLSVTCLLVFLTFENACCQIKADLNLENAKSAIQKSNAVYFKAFVNGDSSLFIKRYAKDCCIMPPNIPSMCGDKAPEMFFHAAYYQMGVRDGKFITKEVYGNANSYVTEEGLFELFDSQGAMIENGKYLVLWKLTSTGWKMFRDSFSSNRYR